MSSSGRSKWKSATRTDLILVCGFGERSGTVKCGLNGLWLGRRGNRPCDGDAGEGFGDDEAVPGAKYPSAMRMEIDGAYRSVDQRGELGDTGLGLLRGASRTVGGDGDVVAIKVCALQVAQADGSVARAGTTNGNEAEAFYCTGDEFAVEAAADEDVEIALTESPCAGEQTAMPDGVDERWGGVVLRDHARLADVFVAQCDSEQTDDHVGQRRDDRQDEALLEGEVL